MAAKIRATITTSLVYGEGSDDEEFLKYIKQTYTPRKTVRFKNGHGGDPVQVVKTMLKCIDFSAYDKRMVLFDDDRLGAEEAICIARKECIFPVVSNQCLEYELLKILGVNKAVLGRARMDSRSAKREFANCSCKHTQESYKTRFSKDKLDKARKTSQWLNDIIDFFEEF